MQGTYGVGLTPPDCTRLEGKATCSNPQAHGQALLMEGKEVGCRRNDDIRTAEQTCCFLVPPMVLTTEQMYVDRRPGAEADTSCHPRERRGPPYTLTWSMSTCRHHPPRRPGDAEKRGAWLIAKLCPKRGAFSVSVHFPSEVAPSPGATM